MGSPRTTVHDTHAASSALILYVPAGRRVTAAAASLPPPPPPPPLAAGAGFVNTTNFTDASTTGGVSPRHWPLVNGYTVSSSMQWMLPPLAFSESTTPPCHTSAAIAASTACCRNDCTTRTSTARRWLRRLSSDSYSTSRTGDQHTKGTKRVTVGNVWRATVALPQEGATSEPTTRTPPPLQHTQGTDLEFDDVADFQRRVW